MPFYVLASHWPLHANLSLRSVYPLRPHRCLAGLCCPFPPQFLSSINPRLYSLQLLHLVKDSLGELVRGVVTTHVACADLAIGNHSVDSLGNPVCVVVEAEVAQKHAARQDQRAGVGLIFALNVETDVTATGLENGHVAAHVAAWHNPRATDKCGTNVGQNTTVQVGHDHNVELLRLGDALHGSVVDNHVVGLDSGVLSGGLLEGGAEETVGQLHDVGLVDAGDLLAVVGQGKAKGKLGNTLRLGAGDDLERLHHALDGLVLQARVLALGVLTDDAHVDTLVAGLVAGHVLDQRDGCVDIELLAHGDVERLVAATLKRGVQNALEAELVAAQGRDSLAESLLSGGTAAGSVETRGIDLLPLDGHVVGLEDGLDRVGDLGADTVTGDEGHGVLATVLGRLEDVALDGRVGSGGDRGLCGGAEEAL